MITCTHITLPAFSESLSQIHIIMIVFPIFFIHLGREGPFSGAPTQLLASYLSLLKCTSQCLFVILLVIAPPYDNLDCLFFTDTWMPPHLGVPHLTQAKLFRLLTIITSVDTVTTACCRCQTSGNCSPLIIVKWQGIDELVRLTHQLLFNVVFPVCVHE